MNRTAILLTAVLALAACGGETRVENTAEQLEEAADQSTPAAAEVLEDRADQVLEQNSVAPADNAMRAAANARLPGQQAGPMAPQSEQARPQIPTE